MKIPRPLLYPLTGWMATAVATVILGLLWPIAFPGIIRVEHYYGAGPNLPVIIAIVLIVVSPAAFVGGLIGGRLSKEGGQGSQMLTAALCGILGALPCGCWGLWFFSGW